MAQVTFIQYLDEHKALGSKALVGTTFRDDLRKTYDTAWLRKHLFELDGWAYELHGDDNSLYKFMMSDIPYEDVIKQIEEAEVKEVEARGLPWQPGRYGFKVVRSTGHRSTYDLDTRGQDGFVVIRHYLPQPLNWPNAPLEGEFPYGPNNAKPLEGKFPGLAVSLEDWPYFLNWMGEIWQGTSHE